MFYALLLLVPRKSQSELQSSFLAQIHTDGAAVKHYSILDYGQSETSASG